MRLLACWLTLGCLALTGCESWKRKNQTEGPDLRPKDQAYGPPTTEKLVGYLNREADKLAIIESDDVDLVTHVQGKRMPKLVSFMVCEKPRGFRLMGDAAGSTWVDIGSNNDRFWFWVKDGDAPLYHCSYTDYEKGVPLPLPFQPEWVVQALGMAKYDPAKPYQIEPKGSTIELIEETKVNGVAVKKVTIFNANRPADRTQPQVIGHAIRDARTNKTICQATVKRVREVPVRTAQGEERVYYPSDVLLEWPAEQITMTIKVGKAKVNHRLTGEEHKRYFDLPNWPGIKTIDLARYSPGGSPTGRDVRHAGGLGRGN